MIDLSSTTLLSSQLIRQLTLVIESFVFGEGGVGVSNAEYTLATKSNSTLSLVCTRHNAAAAAADDDDNDDDDAVC